MTRVGSQRHKKKNYAYFEQTCAHPQEDSRINTTSGIIITLC
jgi:hypothetical protein